MLTSPRGQCLTKGIGASRAHEVRFPGIVIGGLADFIGLELLLLKRRRLHDNYCLGAI